MHWRELDDVEDIFWRETERRPRAYVGILVPACGQSHRQRLAAIQSAPSATMNLHNQLTTVKHAA